MYAIKEDLSALDAREVGYTRMEISASLLTPVDWRPIPDSVKFYVYVPNGKDGIPGQGLEKASYKFPIPQTYVDTCLTGCLEYSIEYAQQFLSSTTGWSQYWLNDRLIPRRPWLNCPRYLMIDKLLKEYPGLEDRKLDVEYAGAYSNSVNEK